MKHGVGGAAKCHINRQSIHNCFLGDDIPGTDILAEQLHNSHTGMFCQLNSLGINRRDGTISAKAHTKCLR